MTTKWLVLTEILSLFGLPPLDLRASILASVAAMQRLIAPARVPYVDSI